ncbi:hypothetical protein [Sphingobium yanoikuyae]|uniref:hypothetical protein n=1 Tax=Sphingobium yanoikuyae TaxID=13690 RepID=UPI00241DE7D1|nr:hypothetical protein [Sphingobium yanoikuyae]
MGKVYPAVEIVRQILRRLEIGDPSLHKISLFLEAVAQLYPGGGVSRLSIEVLTVEICGLCPLAGPSGLSRKGQWPAPQISQHLTSIPDLEMCFCRKGEVWLIKMVTYVISASDCERWADLTGCGKTLFKAR